MSRCTRCIMPDTYQGIFFNDRGVCSLCEETPEAPVHESRLDDLGRRVRSFGRGGVYDCVVPLSGGKDSTYILYSAVKDLGLRVIALNYDAGFQSDEGRNNVRNACEALGVKLVIVRPEDATQRAMLREMLEVSRVLGRFTRTCTSCELMLRSASVRVAREHGVPVILWGSASAESAEAQEYDEYRNGRSPLSILASKCATLKSLKLTPSQAAHLLPHFLKYTAISTRQRIRMDVPLACVFNPYGLMPFPESNPAVVHYFDYASWDPHENTELLERELGWQHPDGRESRFDCQLYAFVEHRHLTLHGISDSGAIDCAFVRANRMSRDEALLRERDRQPRIVTECDELARSLGVEPLAADFPR